MTNPLIIDISHYQPTPDWDAVKAGGTIGVILKATEGASYTDPTFQSRWIACKEHGLCRSAYHFLRPGDIMATQMSHFVETVEPSPTERLVLDYEDENVSFNDLELAAKYLLDAGYQVTVYGSNILVDACKGKHSEVLSRTSLWQARYSSNEPQVPTNIWPTWSLWQYTDSAPCSGINAKVDGNYWNGDPADLPAWFDSAAAPTPQPQPLPTELVDMIITTPPGVRLRLIVNGMEYIT
jgi:lysozyme